MRHYRLLLGLAIVVVTWCASSTPSAGATTVPSAAPSAGATTASSVGAATSAPSPAPTSSVHLSPIPVPVEKPGPSGPAGNGRLVWVDAGAVRWLDVETGDAGILSAGVPDTGTVVPSRDGTKLALISPTEHWYRQLTVLGIDGRGIRTIPGTWSEEVEIDWSPDGSELGIASDDTGLAKLTVAPIDGSMPTTFDLPLDARHLHYLADGRLVFKGTRETADGQRFALYVTGGPDGSWPISAETDQLTDIIDATPSSDGTKLVYHRWRDPDQHGRIRVIDVATGADTALAVDYPTEEFADEIASFSPDGSLVVFVRFRADGNQLVVVPSTGGTPAPIGKVTPGNDAPEARFSPDGRSVLARYHDGEVWILDATGKGGDRQLDLAVDRLPAWLRVAP